MGGIPHLGRWKPYFQNSCLGLKISIFKQGGTERTNGEEKDGAANSDVYDGPFAAVEPSFFAGFPCLFFLLKLCHQKVGRT